MTGGNIKSDKRQIEFSWRKSKKDQKFQKVIKFEENILNLVLFFYFS